ncbi:hypothetical protein BY996DRAFT_6722861 [Phakopsora pachyrhizi]|nr:hypothetical protein BY996DRAFT_6722861 [Phakopsora pachyrhizi]
MSFNISSQTSDYKSNRFSEAVINEDLLIRKRHIRWDKDSIDGGRSSIEVLIDWLETDENYSQWIGHSELCLKKETLASEILSNMIKEGINHRDVKGICTKVQELLDSYHRATSWLRGMVSNQNDEKISNDKAIHEEKDRLRKICRYWDRLDPIISKRSLKSNIKFIKTDESRHFKSDNGLIEKNFLKNHKENIESKIFQDKIYFYETDEVKNFESSSEILFYDESKFKNLNKLKSSDSNLKSIKSQKRNLKSNGSLDDKDDVDEILLKLTSTCTDYLESKRRHLNHKILMERVRAKSNFMRELQALGYPRDEIARLLISTP